MKFDFITIGGATEDITFYTSEGVLINNKKDILRQNLLAFEYGAKLKVDKSYSTYGGGAANTAVSFAKLGFKTASLIAVGGDIRGEGIVRNLKKFKVNTGLVQEINHAESGFSFLLTAQNNEHIVFSNRAANGELRIPNWELKVLKKTKWIYMASLSGDWKEILKRVFGVEGPRIAWNPGHIQLHAGYNTIGKYLKKTHFLTVNKDEAIELVVSHKNFKNKDNKFLNNTKNLLRVIHGWGPKIAVITSGEKGADAYDGEKYYHQDILKERRRVDTTGVGDAFGSTFAAGLEIFKGDIQAAMRLGVKNSASVVSEYGAQNGLLSRKEILNAG